MGFLAKKIIIDVNGLLLVQREYDEKPHSLICPFRAGHHHCGQWCPHFGEPRRPYVLPFVKEEGEEEKFFDLELSCGSSAIIRAEEVVRQIDHLAEIRGIMEPPQASFKERLHNRAGDEA